MRERTNHKHRCRGYFPSCCFCCCYCSCDCYCFHVLLPLFNVDGVENFKIHKMQSLTIQVFAYTNIHRPHTTTCQRQWPKYRKRKSNHVEVSFFKVFSFTCSAIYGTLIFYKNVGEILRKTCL